ncbi:HAD family hydrolase [Staphylothermus hellenicus]|uniref:HAD-superfamily hydrolase, subfamily IA, variant 3 n=1 Tax=Staphylothermus hellenicus (strain DSM 12710 / JCM 10830 / BK20S6-10-b1 / P8) TaxID=591019 RepID=D7DAF6_STAHD|nr:HAD family hydrolase [Staphylothermus hellenicus]ADI32752.1 HAD-superfamily hydrolase, subfamily IA, variant 3 [Staphylothermus hellenicus DSM 12710]
MNSTRAIKAVLFDMDGTIINSVELIAECWSKAFKKHGIRVEPQNIYRVVGLPADIILEKYTRTKNAQLHNSILEQARKCFEEKMDPNTLLYNDALETINQLRKNNKLCGIVTSSSCKRTIDLLKKLNIIEFFDTIQCYHGKLRGKPHPDLLLSALNKLGIKPSQAIYVGDSYIDYLTARNTGVLFVLVKRSWNTHIIDECIESCIVISDLREINNLVANKTRQ